MAMHGSAGTRNILVYIGKGKERISVSHLDKLTEGRGLICNKLTLVIGDEPFKYNDSAQQIRVREDCVSALKEFYQTFLNAGHSFGRDCKLFCVNGFLRNKKSHRRLYMEGRA